MDTLTLVGGQRVSDLPPRERARLYAASLYAGAIIDWRIDAEHVRPIFSELHEELIDRGLWLMPAGPQRIRVVDIKKGDRP